MATEKAETDRIPVTSVPGVARTLIEEGIRLAIKDGLLSIRDNGKS
jgi:hypothetical protein